MLLAFGSKKSSQGCYYSMCRTAHPKSTFWPKISIVSEVIWPKDFHFSSKFIINRFAFFTIFGWEIIYIWWYVEILCLVTVWSLLANANILAHQIPINTYTISVILKKFSCTHSQLVPSPPPKTTMVWFFFFHCRLLCPLFWNVKDVLSGTWYLVGLVRAEVIRPQGWGS